jgi:hypothetical protein
VKALEGEAITGRSEETGFGGVILLIGVVAVVVETVLPFPSINPTILTEEEEGRAEDLEVREDPVILLDIGLPGEGALSHLADPTDALGHVLTPRGLLDDAADEGRGDTTTEEGLRALGGEVDAGELAEGPLGAAAVEDVADLEDACEEAGPVVGVKVDLGARDRGSFGGLLARGHVGDELGEKLFLNPRPILADALWG